MKASAQVADSELRAIELQAQVSELIKYNRLLRHELEIAQAADGATFAGLRANFSASLANPMRSTDPVTALHVYSDPRRQGPVTIVYPCMLPPVEAHASVFVGAMELEPSDFCDGIIAQLEAKSYASLDRAAFQALSNNVQLEIAFQDARTA